MNHACWGRHRRHANPFSLRGPLEPLDFAAIFGRQAPLALDVGCGTGQFTVGLAGLHPEYNVLGVEMRRHLVGLTAERAASQAVPYVHALLANANTQLPQLLPAQSVAFVAINFPDPWYKTRHHKRRVVQAAWLSALRPTLRPGAHIHAMSDYLPVAEHMRRVFAQTPDFIDQHPTGYYPAHSAHGVTSEREQTHLGRQERIYHLHMIYDG